MRLLLALLTLLLVTSAALAAPAPCYDWILKDHIRGGYMGSANLGEGQARMKAVGMNLLMPKFGNLQYPPTEDNIALLRRWAENARANGLYLMPVFNFRGGETEKILTDRREVTLTGEIMQKTACPLDETFWQKYIEGRMVWLAEHAKELGLHGAILDPEMYGADHASYSGVCYCPDCFREFGAATGKTLPEGTPAGERLAWLKQNGLEKAFEQHMVDRVKGFCQKIEKATHQKNSDFIIGTLHPDVGGPFTRGLAMGLGTEQYPLLGFSEMTYSSGYTDYVDEQQATFAKMPAYVLFVPGLWQQQFPTENLAEQYFSCAMKSHGYWIYTFESLLADQSKNPGYQLREPADKYWEAMKTANLELDALAADPAHVSALKVRPFDPPLRIIPTNDLPIEALVAAPDDKPVSLGPVILPRLRGRNPMAILCKAGEPLKVSVTSVQLARYMPGTQWVLVGPDGTRLQEGHLKVRESGEMSYTPEKDGVYLLVVESANNSHRLQVLSGQPNVYFASAKHNLNVNGIFGRMYFYVPKGTEKFSIFAKATGQAAGRGAKITIYGPDAKPAANLSGDLGAQKELTVAVPAEGQGRVWCLAAEDISNDLTLFFSDNMPGYCSVQSDKVLTTKP